MKIKINRQELGNEACIGTLTVESDGKTLFECYTLEEDVYASVKKEDGTYEGGKDERIPKGVYKLDRHNSAKYNPKISAILGKETMPVRLSNAEVPKERCILIHSGNTDEHTLGCVLLGMTKSKDFIGNSKEAVKKFYSILDGVDLNEVELEIEDPFVSDDA